MTRPWDYIVERSEAFPRRWHARYKPTGQLIRRGATWPTRREAAEAVAADIKTAEAIHDYYARCAAEGRDSGD